MPNSLTRAFQLLGQSKRALSSTGAMEYVRLFVEVSPHVKEHAQELEGHRHFCTVVNTIAHKYFRNASDLQAIRDTYTNPLLTSEIESVIHGHTLQAEKSAAVLKSLARNVIKFHARNVMFQLGNAQEVHQIHKSNFQKYGNLLGPTVSTLVAKYGNSEELAHASKRKRSPEDMKRDFGNLRKNNTNNSANTAIGNDKPDLK